MKDGDVALRASEIGGLDNWIDPALSYAFLCSDALAEALMASGLANAFELKTCRLLPD